MIGFSDLKAHVTPGEPPYPGIVLFTRAAVAGSLLKRSSLTLLNIKGRKRNILIGNNAMANVPTEHDGDG